MVSLDTRIGRWLQRRQREALLKRFGGIQTCPWCRQCAQAGTGEWSFRPWDNAPTHDVLTCSVCGGTSVWLFALGMTYVGPLAPPSPAFKEQPYFVSLLGKAKMPPADED